MFMPITTGFLLYYTLSSMALPIVKYNNAYFVPFDTRYTLSNISSVSSSYACLCQCYNSTICFTVTYFGTAQRCILYLTRINSGQLQIVPTSANASVYDFGNRSTQNLTFFKLTNETVYSIWNTRTGGNASLSSSGTSTGMYWPGQSAKNVFDDNLTTEYTNHGMCNFTLEAMSLTCGENTGFYLTMNGVLKTVTAFYMGTNTWTTSRDPLVVTIEGSNLSGSDLLLGSSWTLIYNGSSGLLTNPGRSQLGVLQVFSSYSVPFASYRFLVTSKRGIQSSAGYSEVQFLVF